jgi:hypothetical protein
MGGATEALCWYRLEVKDAGSKGGGRPSILAMDLASAAALGPIRGRTPIGLLVILLMASVWPPRRSTAEVFEVFHQLLEAIKPARLPGWQSR